MAETVRLCTPRISALTRRTCSALLGPRPPLFAIATPGTEPAHHSGAETFRKRIPVGSDGRCGRDSPVRSTPPTEVVIGWPELGEYDQGTYPAVPGRAPLQAPGGSPSMAGSEGE